MYLVLDQEVKDTWEWARDLGSLIYDMYSISQSIIKLHQSNKFETKYIILLVIGKR